MSNQNHNNVHKVRQKTIDLGLQSPPSRSTNRFFVLSCYVVDVSGLVVLTYTCSFYYPLANNSVSAKKEKKRKDKVAFFFSFSRASFFSSSSCVYINHQVYAMTHTHTHRLSADLLTPRVKNDEHKRRWKI